MHAHFVFQLVHAGSLAVYACGVGDHGGGYRHSARGAVYDPDTWHVSVPRGYKHYACITRPALYMHLMALCTYDACGETNELKIVLQEHETLSHWYKKPAALVFCCLLCPIESYTHFIIYHFFFF